jgi:hypothetical protein
VSPSALAVLRLIARVLAQEDQFAFDDTIDVAGRLPNLVYQVGPICKASRR